MDGGANPAPWGYQADSRQDGPRVGFELVTIGAAKHRHPSPDSQHGRAATSTGRPVYIQVPGVAGRLTITKPSATRQDLFLPERAWDAG